MNPYEPYWDGFGMSVGIRPKHIIGRGRPYNRHDPSIDGECIEGNWGRARGLTGGAFMGTLLAANNGGLTMDTLAQFLTGTYSGRYYSETIRSCPFTIFKNNPNLTELDLPNVTDIPVRGSFAGSSSLEIIRLPSQTTVATNYFIDVGQAPNLRILDLRSMPGKISIYFLRGQKYLDELWLSAKTLIDGNNVFESTIKDLHLEGCTSITSSSPFSQSRCVAGGTWYFGMDAQTLFDKGTMGLVNPADSVWHCTDADIKYVNGVRTIVERD